MTTGSLYTDIKTILEQAKANAVRAVNFAMVVAYWKIGRLIIEEEQRGRRRAAFGDATLKELSLELTRDFGKGFGENNLRNMRLFYQTFPIRDAVGSELEGEDSAAIAGSIPNKSVNSPIRYALRSELSWTHYRLLMRVENEESRKYYMNEAAAQNWSTRTLERQINSLYFERLLPSKNKKTLLQQTENEAAQDKPTILDFVKDPCVLEFLQFAFVGVVSNKPKCKVVTAYPRGITALHLAFALNSYASPLSRRGKAITLS